MIKAGHDMKRVSEAVKTRGYNQCFIRCRTVLKRREHFLKSTDFPCDEDLIQRLEQFDRLYQFEY